MALIAEWNRKSLAETIPAVNKEFIMQTVPLNNDSVAKILTS